MSFKFALAGAAMLSALVGGAASAVPATTIPVYEFGKTSPYSLAGPSDFTINEDSSGTTVTAFNALVTRGSSTATLNYPKTAGAFKSNSTMPIASVPAGTAFAYAADFKLGSAFFAPGANAALLNFKLVGNPNGTPAASSFYLEDLSTPGGPTVIATSTLVSGNLVLSGLLKNPGANDVYSVVLLVSSSLTGLGSNAFTITGSVPVPGSLLMFGAFLIGLVGFSYSSKRRQGW
jgi:hypothetical protein